MSDEEILKTTQHAYYQEVLNCICLIRIRAEYDLFRYSLAKVLNDASMADVVAEQILNKAFVHESVAGYIEEHGGNCLKLASMGCPIDDLLYCNGFFPPLLVQVYQDSRKPFKVDARQLRDVYVESVNAKASRRGRKFMNPHYTKKKW